MWVETTHAPHVTGLFAESQVPVREPTNALMTSGQFCQLCQGPRALDVVEELPVSVLEISEHNAETLQDFAFEVIN